LPGSIEALADHHLLVLGARFDLLGLTVRIARGCALPPGGDERAPCACQPAPGARGAVA
jgi:hypothetical protein